VKSLVVWPLGGSDSEEEMRVRSDPVQARLHFAASFRGSGADGILVTQDSGLHTYLLNCCG
jgi:hypothetical protein